MKNTSNSKLGYSGIVVLLMILFMMPNYHYFTEYLPHRNEFHIESALVLERTHGRSHALSNDYRVGYGYEQTFAKVNCSFNEGVNDTIMVAVADGTKHYVKNIDGTNEPDTSSSYYLYPVQRPILVLTPMFVVSSVIFCGGVMREIFKEK